MFQVAILSRPLGCGSEGPLAGIADYRSRIDLRPRGDLPTLDEHVSRFLETVRKSGTRKTYRLGLEHLRAFTVDGVRLGAGAWADVHPHVVREARDALLRTLADSTVATYLASWSAFFDWALEREESEATAAGIDPVPVVNPVRKAAAWIQVHPTRHRFLTEVEFDALLAAAAAYMRAQYATLACCGLRGSELRHLPPNHVEPARRIRIAPWGSWVPKGYPRSVRGVRNVPVHQERLRPLLEEYAEEWAGEVTFFVNPRTGEPWSEVAFRDQFYRDVEAAGLVAKRAGRGCDA